MPVEIPVQEIFSRQSILFGVWLKGKKVKNTLGLGLEVMVSQCLWEHGKFINLSSKAGLTEHRAKPERIGNWHFPLDFHNLSARIAGPHAGEPHVAG
jgi:hypothetical protein